MYRVYYSFDFHITDKKDNCFDLCQKPHFFVKVMPQLSIIIFGNAPKTPPVAGVGGVSVGPGLAAVVEVEGPSRQRTLGFTCPHPPSGGFQQRRHVAFPCSLLIQGFKLLPCRHPPSAAGNIQALNPCFSRIPVSTPIRPGIPFKPRIFVVKHFVFLTLLVWLPSPPVPASD